MSLYHEAAGYLEKADKSKDSLSSQIYGNKSLKSKPAQVYALVVEAAKWSSVLSKVIEHAGILQIEKKLSPQLALVLVHDLLLSKQGVALPKGHGLRGSVERHKARLNSEFTKARLKAGQPSIDSWRTAVGGRETADGDGQLRHPRWVRINTLAGTDPLSGAFAGYEKSTPAKVASAGPNQKMLAVDQHLPHLIALPSGTDLTKDPAYRDGSIILQDKASCFSAYLLNPTPEDGDFIDACAAPGNKTTHLAALLEEARATVNIQTPIQRVYACERDKLRAQTLAKMTKIADPRGKAHIECLLGQDFLRLKPSDSRFANVGALLLDPSCSGTGIVKRSGTAASALNVTLPNTTGSTEATQKRTNIKKRKRRDPSSPPPSAPTVVVEAEEEQEPIPDELEESPDSEALKTRLANLSAFQLKIVQHAFSFPKARRVVYSTCSIHAEENEVVVMRALASPVAREKGWRVMRRDEQVEGMRKWGVRGDLEAVQQWRHSHEDAEGANQDDEVIAEACIRCEKGTEECTMGFFVAGFVRDVDSKGDMPDAGALELSEDDDWEGFESD